MILERVAMIVGLLIVFFGAVWAVGIVLSHIGDDL